MPFICCSYKRRPSTDYKYNPHFSRIIFILIFLFFITSCSEDITVQDPSLSYLAGIVTSSDQSNNIFKIRDSARSLHTVKVGKECKYYEILDFPGFIGNSVDDKKFFPVKDQKVVVKYQIGSQRRHIMDFDIKVSKIFIAKEIMLIQPLKSGKTKVDFFRARVPGDNTLSGSERGFLPLIIEDPENPPMSFCHEINDPPEKGCKYLSDKSLTENCTVFDKPKDVECDYISGNMIMILFDILDKDTDGRFDIILGDGPTQEVIDDIGVTNLALKIAAVERFVVAASILLDSNGNWTDRSQGKMMYDVLKKKIPNFLVISAFEQRVQHADGRLQALFLFVKLGIPKSESALIQVLDSLYDAQMAEDFLNSGSEALRKGAMAWCEKHGYKINQGDGSHRVSWGNF